MEEFVLIKYLKGTLDAESCEKVEKWVSLSEENRKKLDDIYVVMFVNDRMAAKNEIDVDKAFRQFLRQKKRLTLSSRKTGTIPLWRKVAAVAAISVVVLLSGAFTLVTLLERNSQPFTVATQLGERAQVTLPDGSTVWLNACSKLEYRKSFLSPKRKAQLSGEAYFDVAHNRHFPFVVMNNGSEIKVLGTKFNVKCNESDDHITTSLMEGSVQFTHMNLENSIKLKPNEKLIFDKNTHRFEVERILSQADVIAWINGKLLFENNTLQEIARSLEKHYNVHIEFGDENAKNIRFKAEFEMADNIYQILSILELTNKFTYQINNRDIVIYSK
ncbi:FecR family protein [Proteiniphilum sp. X52]|uniref:FecR family protein n=1 Tax=Proteiniphilum sp. X52 TaxID=2382159 RepID=UPI0013141CD8|nr:FecR domain-containing protein [Proteiniphilum sp. X52]